MKVAMWTRVVEDVALGWTTSAELVRKTATGVRAFDPLKNTSIDFDSQTPPQPVRPWALAVGYTDALDHIDDSVAAGIIQADDILVIPEFSLGASVASMGSDRLTPLLARMLADGFPNNEIAATQSFQAMMDLIVSKTDAVATFADLWNDERA